MIVSLLTIYINVFVVVCHCQDEYIDVIIVVDIVIKFVGRPQKIENRMFGSVNQI